MMMKQADGRLAPSLEHDAEKLRRIKLGDIVECTIVKKRNGKHHRKAMALLQFLFDNQDRYDVFKDFLVEVKLRTGHYYEHITVKGTIMYLPKSIAYENMDQVEFDLWYNKVINAALKYFVKGMSRVELEKAVEVVMGFAS